MESKITLLFILLFSWTTILGQDNYALAKKAVDGYNYFEALSHLNEIENIDSDLRALVLRAKVHFRSNQLDRTIRDLTRARKQGYDEPDLYWIMGQAMQNKSVYKEAIHFYKLLLQKVDDQSDQAVRARIEIKNCLFAIQKTKTKKQLLVQGFGTGINTIANELYVVQSPQFGNLFYYSIDNGKQMSMKASFLSEQGQWLPQEGFNKMFSGSDDQWLSDISSDGQNLFFFKKEKDQTRLFLSSIVGDKTKISTFDNPHFKNALDIQILDSTTCVFVADKPDGYGGYDIYTVTYENGSWQEPVNMGPEINSPYDERTPYLSHDRHLMYFSSNKPYCYGGYDIYKADMRNEIVEVSHINSSINSTGNDLGFRFHNDAQMAFFYSDRKTGQGGYDLFFAYLDEPSAFVWADSTQLEYLIKETEYIPVKEENTVQHMESSAEKRTEDTRSPQVESSLVNEVTTNAETKPDALEAESPSDKSDIIIEPKLKEEIFYGNSLFYNDKTDLLREENAVKLSRIMDLLREREDLNIKLIVYADHNERGLPEYLQYNNLKRGLTIADYLLLNGITSDRIAIESYANNYPVAKNEVAGKTQKELSKYNRRIDIELFDWQGTVYWAPDIRSFPVPEYARAREYALFSNIREEVYFSIKIAEVDRMYKNAILRLYQDVYVRKDGMDNPNEYYIGIYTDYASAEELAKNLSKYPRVNAEVVPFYNGNKINKVDINRLEISYPELSHLKE